MNISAGRAGSRQCRPLEFRHPDEDDPSPCPKGSALECMPTRRAIARTPDVAADCDFSPPHAVAAHAAPRKRDANA
ncbi:hypothetical protein BURPS1655_A2156 [Burkholderia pseudomallei 1655]|nr:hypothetical protein BURPS1655_A2156 [Burkholderia pseudomallei 1655]